MRKPGIFPPVWLYASVAGGKGVVFEYSDENRTKVSGSCRCPTCLGSGRVKVTSSVVTTIKPFVPGKDDKEGELTM